MKPRLNSSKKWTALPPELLAQVRTVFEEAFEKQKAQGEFITEGRIFQQELLFRVGFIESGRLKQVNFEVSIDFNPAKQNALELIHLAIDCTASMMETHFTEEEAFDDMPSAWKPVEIDGRRIHVQVSTENSRLEDEANKLLGEEAESSLVVGDDGEELETTVKKMLGIDDVGAEPEESEAAENRHAHGEEGHVHDENCDHGDDDDEPSDGRNRKDH